MEVGLLFAVATIFFFGSWAVPTTRIKASPNVQAFWLTVGHFLLSVAIFIFSSQTLGTTDIIYPFIAGVLWAVGIAAGYRGIKELGITRALGIWIPIVIVTSATWGLFYFDEINTLGTTKLLQVLIAIGFLIAAALLIIFSSHREEKIGNLKLGIVMSAILGIFHGSFFVPLQQSNAPIYATFLPLTAGMVITMSIILFVKKLNPTHTKISVGRMMTAGLILGAGNYAALLTVEELGVSRGYPLTQLGIVVNTLWGVFYFKEATTNRSKTLIGLGVLVALFGAIFLNLARQS